MGDLHSLQRRALEYIRNAGGAPEIGWFDDDHEPVGPRLREDLKRLGMVEENHTDGLGADTITLTEAGVAAIAGASNAD